LELDAILSQAVQQGASDVHLRAGLQPMLRVKGSFEPLANSERLKADQTLNYAAGLMSRDQKERFAEHMELDLAYGVRGLGRFRVNIFRQRLTLGLVFRVIPSKVPVFEDLRLPQVLELIAAEQRGLILVTGATGSGKSTTLAALVDYINKHRSAHILTIEDPIEFVHRDHNCVISQREIGSDTKTFGSALRAALRQDPDVILVGEMRDVETIEVALAAAETGHLVISTLHTVNATETLDRITSLFAPHQQSRIRLQLGSLLRAIISQRLVPLADGSGRVPAVEVLVNKGQIRDYIESEAKNRELNDAIARGSASYGCQTFDQSLYVLYSAGLISYDDAMLFATNADDLALRASGVISTSSSF
jgi:twitching motility protein PilT